MRTKIEYFDISMASFNAIILVFTALRFQGNLLLLIINLISIGVLCGLAIYTFSQNNPYYVVSCYFLAVLGILFTIGLITDRQSPDYLIILSAFIFILDLYLLASLVKGSASSSARFARMSGVQVIIEPGITPTAIKDRNMGAPKANLQDIEDERKLKQKKYKYRLIVLITVISGITYLLTVLF